MKHILASVSIVALSAAFSSEIEETVVVGGIRMDKSAYNAMPEADRPAIDQKATDDQDGATIGALPVSLDAAAPMPPSPSAPHFGNVVTPDVPSHDSITIKREGTGKNAKYFVVWPDGTHVENFRDVDAGGYPDESQAWTAVMAAKKAWYEQNITPPPGMPSADKAADDAKDAAKA